MNALNILRKAKEFLESFGIKDAAREAEIIISHLLGIDRSILYRDNPQIPEDIIPIIDECLRRRSKREPLQYIIGYTEFHGLKIKVGSGVLIPRPETELLAEEAIKTVTSYKINPPLPPFNKGRVGGLKILDLCTGSGCLALAIAREFPDAQVYGTDTSEIAIGYANENAKINGIENAIFLEGSLFDPIKKLFTVHRSPFTFDLIVSNPPYIRRDNIKSLQAEIRDWEPVEALDGGEDGLDYYRIITPEARNYLKENGCLMFEIAFGQADAVRKMAEDEGFADITLIKDFAGIERIIIMSL